VATRKITITLPEETLAALRAAAAGAGIPLSTYVAQVTEHHARIQDGLAAIREWEAVSGPIDPEVQTAVDREIDRLDSMIADATPMATDARRRAG